MSEFDRLNEAIDGLNRGMVSSQEIINEAIDGLNRGMVSSQDIINEAIDGLNRGMVSSQDIINEAIDGLNRGMVSSQDTINEELETEIQKARPSFPTYEPPPIPPILPRSTDQKKNAELKNRVELLERQVKKLSRRM